MSSVERVHNGLDEKRSGSSRPLSGAHDIEEDTYDDEDKQQPTAVPSPSSSPSTPDNDQLGPIDVEAAKAEFESLRRTLSRASSLHRVATGQKSIEDAHDDDDFDLKDYLVGHPSLSFPYFASLLGFLGALPVELKLWAVCLFILHCSKHPCHTSFYSIIRSVDISFANLSLLFY
jgi:hypothetical protein